MRAWIILALAAGCAPLAVEKKGDALFRSAIAAQIGGDSERAESDYRRIVQLGLEWSPVWNNLAVLAVKRHEYTVARHLLAQAVRANDRDVVALTNYGVMSYYLADLREAERTLRDARALRHRLLESIATTGADDYAHARYERVTDPLDKTAAKYLDRIAKSEVSSTPIAEDFTAEVELPQKKF